MLLKQIDVSLPNHSYPIYIGQGIFNDTHLLKKHIPGKQVMIISDEAVADRYLQNLLQALSDFQCDHLILPPGEQFKDLTHWEKIINALASHKHHRDSTLITLGGGVIGDMGGFAAASYQRGINFIQIPTTLLSQVDASIGGKVAVNHPVGKNLIGAFYQPNAVIIDIETLKTLPEREFCSGLAEIIKAALIQDNTFFSWLERHYRDILLLQTEHLTTAIYQACLIKKNIVVQDEKELHIRALLNLGHTFAHAIEHELQYGYWLHGEAVAVGLVLAAKLSCHLKLLSVQDSKRIEDLLRNMRLPVQLPQQIAKQNLINAMHMDKKIKQNKLHFILLKNIGTAFISKDVRLEDLQIL